jgi:hypothetical protein
MKLFHLANNTLISLFLIHISSVAITKTELIRMVSDKSSKLNYGISANFTSKISAQNQIIIDSGTFYFSPPNKSKVEFINSKIISSTIGDTTWTKLVNGDITRSIAKKEMPDGAGNSSFTSPDLSSYLKNNDFEIISEDTSAIAVKLTMLNNSPQIPFTFYIDPKLFVVKRMGFPTPMTGEFQIGYKYKLFQGRLVVEEINTVMGSIGFSRIKISDYKRINKGNNFYRIF